MRTWCAYCKRRGHSLYEDRVTYIQIVCLKSRLLGRCYMSHEFLTALFNAREQLPQSNGKFLLLCRHLWELDERLTAGTHYSISPRLADDGSSEEDADAAQGAAAFPVVCCMFQYVNEDIFKKESYKNFVELLKIFGVSEVNYDAEETQEQVGKFLDIIIGEPPCKRLFSFLVETQLVGNDITQFKDKLRELWFCPYNTPSGVSCAFQRVFVGKPEIQRSHGYRIVKPSNP
ncbi:uridylate-specific endoribonuclease B-like [Saccoglossus kowalevskii]|uniref:Uridylate-specific endoribonuclease n=1 Tax=Saccoglossus kowalevskii TaxID=10224 RepID=A0ABM0MPZ7_SACKO|nr:PREDICTED: poly(U)-specific endoribonuclease-B-like [Saccoglossus kowalevskii]